MLIDGTASEDDLELAARLTARFGKGREAETVTLTVTDTAGNSHETPGYADCRPTTSRPSGICNIRTSAASLNL